MTAHAATATSQPPTGHAADLPLYQLQMMRVGYLVMGVGLAVVKWPLVIGYDPSTPLYEGVVAVLLTAMSLLAFLGLRYPVRMLPILLFETLWKVIWLGRGAARGARRRRRPGHEQDHRQLRAGSHHRGRHPWRYVWQRYITAKGDPWRRSAA